MNPIALLPPPLRAAAEVIVTVLAAALLAYAAQAYVVKPYRVPTGSMIPTLQPGDRILADRLTLDLRNPHRGEIVVFHPPVCGARTSEGACTTPDRNARTGISDVTFVKRVVGLPGETIWARDGHLYVRSPGGHGHALSEPYLDGRRTRSFPRTRLPAGCYFMMGDNRSLSDDSRTWGCEPRSAMVGIARVRYWPAPRIGLL